MTGPAERTVASERLHEEVGPQPVAVRKQMDVWPGIRSNRLATLCTAADFRMDRHQRSNWLNRFDHASGLRGRNL